MTATEMRGKVESVWRADTSASPGRWTPTNPSIGHCAVTALLVQDWCGGDLLRAKVDGESHYWNRLPDGSEVDITRDQFGDPEPVIPAGEIRTREYVLSFPATILRYEMLKTRVEQG